MVDLDESDEYFTLMHLAQRTDGLAVGAPLIVHPDEVPGVLSNMKARGNANPNATKIPNGTTLWGHPLVEET